MRYGYLFTWLAVVSLVNAQNVGIGIANPGAKLHVFGNGYLLTDSLFLVQNDQDGIADSVLVMDRGGNVGIGIPNPQDKLVVKGSVAAGVYVGKVPDVQHSWSTGSVIIPDSNIAFYTTMLNQQGIALLAETESQDLSVTWGRTASNTLPGHIPRVQFRRASGTLAAPQPPVAGQWLGAINAGGYHPTKGWYLPDACGIIFYTSADWTSTSTPVGIALRGTPIGATSSVIRIDIHPQGSIDLRTNTTSALYIASNANVGIGTTTPTYQLQLSLDAAAKPASSTWIVISDERLKSITAKYTKGLKEVLQLQPIVYSYKNSAGGLFDSRVLNQTFVGFTAQAVAKIFPEAVDTASNGYLGINLHPILVAYVNAIKELSEQNKLLEEKIKMIEDQNRVLQEKISELERITKAQTRALKREK